MTFRTPHRQTHPDLNCRVHAIFDGSNTEFFVVGTPFVVRHRIAMKGGSDPLLFGGIGKQIPGQEFQCQLIKRHVRVQCRDDPVTERPHRPAEVFFISFRIGITGQIQPHACPVFAELR